MGGANKLNGDSNANANKPLPQRQMRQYQGTQSNSSLNYGGEPQSLGKPMHGSHGGHPGQNSNSPPLQTGVPQQPYKYVFEKGKTRLLSFIPYIK